MGSAKKHAIAVGESVSVTLPLCVVLQLQAVCVIVTNDR